MKRISQFLPAMRNYNLAVPLEISQQRFLSIQDWDGESPYELKLGIQETLEVMRMWQEGLKNTGKTAEGTTVSGFCIAYVEDMPGFEDGYYLVPIIES